jgi:hypothetical protein
MHILYNWQLYMSNRKIEQLRYTSEIGIKKVKQVTGVSYLNASIQFYASKEYKDLTFHTYKMPCWISIFKRIITHINIQIQTINSTR